jgi:hypothetical protein
MHYQKIPSYQKLPRVCHICGKKRGINLNMKKSGWVPDGKGVMCKGCAKKAFEPTNMKADLIPRKETDLLFGMTSHAERGLHYFLADLDNVSLEEVMMRVGKHLYTKEHFGKVYVMKTGKGYHLCEFTHPISLRRYVRLLKAIKADVNFIKWVGKVKYGVLRLSRRSGHWNVPYLVVVLNNPDSHLLEDTSRMFAYMMCLSLENDIREVERVDVFE